MINVHNLTKIFKKKISKESAQNKFSKENIIAVDHLNFHVKKGEIFGLIGPNGAGKTTTIKMLSTLILPDEGTATINGYDITKDANVIKDIVGVLAGEFTRVLYWRLTGKQNLRFFAKLRNMWDANKRIDELIELFDLKKWENELVMRYSTGMKHKLALAIALLNDPLVLFLDEPLTGIDPVTAYDIKSMIRNEFKDKTIIWASHNLYEIEEMCDKIALINNGKIISEGSPDELKRNYWDYEKIVINSNDAHLIANVKNAEVKGEIIEIRTKNVTEAYAKIMELVKEKNIKIREIKTLKPSLEEIFMASMKNDK